MNESHTKQCPECKARMVKKNTGTVLTTDPPQYPYDWWCGCGHEEVGGIERDLTREEKLYRRWKSFN